MSTLLFLQSQTTSMTQFDTILLSAVGAIVTGLVGLVTWVVKGAGPRIMAALEKRNDALVSASEKTAEAVSKIPEAIKSFEVALLGAEKRLVEEIHESKEKIVGELHDNRLSELTSAVREKVGPRPSSPG